MGVQQEGEWNRKKNLKGSESRDDFKHMHKQLDSSFWATDLDFVLIDKYPPGVVALLDYKKPSDEVSFTEAILYNLWIKRDISPVFIIEAINPNAGPYVVREYEWGYWSKFPPDIKYKSISNLENRDAYEDWERRLRNEYRKRHKAK